METKKEKEIMRRKKWNNWRETKTGLFVFLFFSPNFFPPRHEQMAARIQQFCTKICRKRWQVTALQMMTNRIKEQIHFLTTKLIDNLWTESCRGRSGRKPPTHKKKKTKQKLSRCRHRKWFNKIDREKPKKSILVCGSDEKIGLHFWKSWKLICGKRVC